MVLQADQGNVTDLNYQWLYNKRSTEPFHLQETKSDPTIKILEKTTNLFRKHPLIHNLKRIQQFPKPCHLDDMGFQKVIKRISDQDQ